MTERTPTTLQIVPERMKGPHMNADTYDAVRSLNARGIASLDRPALLERFYRPAEDATTERFNAIRTLHAMDWTQDRIARALRCSKSTVVAALRGEDLEAA